MVKANTRGFPKQDLLDLISDEEVEGYTFIEDELVDQSRWALHHTLVFSYENKYWRASYSVGSTEYQDERPFENEGESVTCYEVTPVVISKTIYELVK